MKFRREVLLLASQLCASLAIAQKFPSFSLHDEEDLDESLGTKCIRSLTSKIEDCHPYVQQMNTRHYRASLGNVTATDQVCTQDCSSSLASWFWTVLSDCSGKKIYGNVPQLDGGFMWSGWNETCVRDPRSKNYCNDIISNFTDVDSYRDMPQTELCHTCYVRRLALMQSSQYSVYNENYKEELEYVYKTCGGSGPTDLPPPLQEEDPVVAPYCLSGRRHITSEGDTCESISNATSVSSAYLYMGNQALLPDCSSIEPGIQICIPIPCQTYYVRPSDTCTSIEIDLELQFGTIRSYNSWINYACSNLQQATDFFGKMICISPQGGTFTGTASPPAATDQPLGDGYTSVPVAPPADIKVAEGTTLNCGKWHIVKRGDSCGTICLENVITIGLFKEVNPSVSKVDVCTHALWVDTAVCVGPTYGWNATSPRPED